MARRKGRTFVGARGARPGRLAAGADLAGAVLVEPSSATSTARIAAGADLASVLLVDLKLKLRVIAAAVDLADVLLVELKLGAGEAKRADRHRDRIDTRARRAAGQVVL